MAKLTTKNIKGFDKHLFQTCHLRCKTCPSAGKCTLRSKLATAVTHG